MSAPNLDKRHELLTLPHNWNSYGGAPVTQAAMDTLDRFQVVPCSDGGLQLETHQGGFDVEICIGPDGTIESGFISGPVGEALIRRWKGCMKNENEIATRPPNILRGAVGTTK